MSTVSMCWNSKSPVKCLLSVSCWEGCGIGKVVPIFDAAAVLDMPPLFRSESVVTGEHCCGDNLQLKYSTSLQPPTISNLMQISCKISGFIEESTYNWWIPPCTIYARVWLVMTTAPERSFWSNTKPWFRKVGIECSKMLEGGAW